jgi:hypothetical protein
MEDIVTVLSPVQQGDIWRVRIRWPNGSVHHFGNFAFEKEAIEWIAAHAFLTKPVTENALSRAEPG